jgi:NADH:ubiquinone reductase (H+-translocating)
VVGGGFGGLTAIRALRKADVDIILVDRHTYNTFQPLLYQVATAALNPGDITWFLRAVRGRQDNVRFLKGTLAAVDHGNRQVRLENGSTVPYDYLVLATGVTTNFFGTPGAEEFAVPLYKRSQALQIRDRLFGSLEDFAAHGQHRELRIAVVGAGATGVETAGALAEFRNNDMPVTYPEIDRTRLHVTLIERSSDVLGPFHEKLRAYARKALAERGVDLRLDTAVKEVLAEGVRLEHDGTEELLPASMVIWAAGVTAHRCVSGWQVPQGRGGRITVDEHWKVTGLEDVFAIGDIAIGPDPLPQLAQPAIQAARHVAKLVKADLRGRADRVAPFTYTDKGTMATIGKASAIAQITHFPRLTGFLAWLIWSALHIALLLGYRNRFATMINLSSKYLFSGSHNAIVGETPDHSRVISR